MKKEFIELDLGEENPEAYEQSLSREGQSYRKNVFIKRDRSEREEWEIEGIEEIDVDALLGEDHPEDSGVKMPDILPEPDVSATEIPVAEEPETVEVDRKEPEAFDAEMESESFDVEPEKAVDEKTREASDVKMDEKFPVMESNTEQKLSILEVNPETGQEEAVYTDTFLGEDLTGGNQFYEETLNMGDMTQRRSDVFFNEVRERIPIVWYLQLPFITLLVLIPVIGWIVAGVLLYHRYHRYGSYEQVREQTKVYVLCIMCLIIAFWIIYAVVMLTDQNQPDQKADPFGTFAVTEQEEWKAAESIARLEAEKRESEEEQAQLRSSAQANIGLDNATVQKPVAAPVIGGDGSLEDMTEPSLEKDLESLAAAEETDDTAQKTESSLQNTEASEGGNLWSSIWDRLAGNDQEIDENFRLSAKEDMEELEQFGDRAAWHSLPELASNVTVLTARYDDRFQEERQAVFAFMSRYEGMEISTQTMNLKSGAIDVVRHIVHWDATLDQTQYRYLGTITDGLPQGMGVVLTASSANNGVYIPLYAGTFVNGSLDGYGMVFRDNGGYYGIVYEGYFSGGKYSGKGTSYVTPSFGTYQSQMQQTDTAGNQYNSEEIAGILSDYIMRYHTAMQVHQSENQIYTYMDVPVMVPIMTERGRYESGNQTGYFIQYGAFGKREYAGILRRGVRSGTGISYFENGQVEYDGEWRNGRFNGKGVLYQQDGTIRYSGEFQNGDIKSVKQ